jgi:hypothetical protein
MPASQATYNWDCCGLTFGYRRFQLGSVRDETQYLYSFTLANFGSVGDIRRSNSVFRDPPLPPAYSWFPVGNAASVLGARRRFAPKFIP